MKVSKVRNRNAESAKSARQVKREMGEVNEGVRVPRG
jgi:hypothetical protein